MSPHAPLRFLNIDEYAFAGAAEPFAVEESRAWKAAYGYVADRLTTPDPKLGRSGPICPFAYASTARKLVRVGVSRLEPGHRGRLVKAVRDAEAAFDKAAEQASAKHLTSVILALPRFDSEEGRAEIEATQKSLKSGFVANGKMVGQFYPGCTESGLHNPDFRPLDAPLPFIAIRHMVERDEPFMVTPADRASFALRFKREMVH